MTEQPTQKDLEFMGQLMTANIKQSQWTQNQLDLSTQREAAEWRTNFMDLFDILDELNEKVDSKRIDGLLAMNEGRRHRANQPFFWEKKNY